MAGDVPGRDLVSTLAGLAPFQQVVSQKLDVRFEPIGAEVWLAALGENAGCGNGERCGNDDDTSH